MAKIYTKKGDDGTTSLWYGGRVPKHDARTEAYGAIDEAGSALGVARSLCTPRRREVAADILRVQSDLFVAGAELATAPEAAERLEDGVSRVTDPMVDALDVAIDRYMDRVELPPKFVIPGGTAAVGPARPRPRDHPPRRAPRRGAARQPTASPRRRCCATSTAPPTSSTRWPASPTPTIPRCSRAARGGLVKAIARRLEGYTHEVEVDGHRVVTDEPRESGGDDEGPSPTRLLTASLAACTATTVEMYANRKGWELGAVEVEVEFAPAPRERAEPVQVDVRIPTALPTSRSSGSRRSPASAPSTGCSPRTSRSRTA